MSGIFARIAAVAGYLPAGVLTNRDLAALYPEWSEDKILQKTGIRERRIAGDGETAADLATQAAQKLFTRHDVSPDSIDFVILSTQAPDYILPTSACLIQHRLGLKTSSGALDVNLGCSGYVYGLSLAKGLIESGSARRVLLLTADTYSKYIHPLDKSVRTLFGDGATATVVEGVEADAALIGPFVFGTDGAGAENLIVRTGGARQPRTAQSAQEKTDSSGNVRSDDNLFMDGPEIMNFTLTTVPKAATQLMAVAGTTLDTTDLVVLHQANAYMMEALRKKMHIPREKFVVHLEHCGNTVSSTIPLALEKVLEGNEPNRGQRKTMLVGFGVGYSWAGTYATI